MFFMLSEVAGSVVGSLFLLRTSAQRARAILTDLERRQAKAYLKQDGDKTLNIRVMVQRGRTYLPQIRQDLGLLERLLATYESHVKK